MIKLVKLTKKYQKQFLEMMDEWTNYKETIIPYALTRIDYHYFDIFVDNIEKVEESKTKVPTSLYFLLDTTENIFIGAVIIRLALTKLLLERGGHIADGIRPSKRNKGYGNILVSLTVQKCKELGIKEILMVCDKENIASKKTIIKNNGVLENEITIDNKIIERYWIKI